MGLRLCIAVLLAGLALAAVGCGHTSPLEGTPWIWSNRWQDGRATDAAGEPTTTVAVDRPLRVAASQTTIAPATADAAQAEPSVTVVTRTKPKRQTEGKRRKRRPR